MTLRADDGTVLEPKEATVLGAQGETLFEPESSGHARKKQDRHQSFGLRVFNLSAGGSILSILAMAVFLIVGGFFFSLLAVAIFAVWLIRRLFRLFAT